MDRVKEIRQEKEQSVCVWGWGGGRLWKASGTVSTKQI